MVKVISWISSNVCGCMDWEDEFSLCVYEEFKCDEVVIYAIWGLVEGELFRVLRG